MSLSRYRLNASIAVADMGRAEQFYEGKLGLSAVQSGADGSKVYASGGDASLHVYPSPDHAGRSTATLATWYVDDVERVVDELTAIGVDFEHYEGVLESGFDYGTNERGGLTPRGRRQSCLVQGSRRKRLVDRGRINRRLLMLGISTWRHARPIGTLAFVSEIGGARSHS